MPSPLQTATIQAAVLNVTSSVLAQLLTAYRRSSFNPSSSSLNPLGLDFVAIIQYLICTLLLTPPNFIWQGFLERTFPGYPIQKGKQKLKVDEDGKGVVVERKLDVTNTAIKVTIDQTIGAAMNTCLFLIILKVLRGGSLVECMEVVHEVWKIIDHWLQIQPPVHVCEDITHYCLLEFWSIMIAGYKLWPLVSIVNFTIIPVERRIVVGSLVGLGWSIFLVLKTAA
ncbi:hypothetical protein MMC13_004760 [Lambiella insularis]|nr:hypothetical protein [Lambiella insularis]